MSAVTLGTQLRAARLAAGLTLAEAAILAQMSIAFVSQIELGKSRGSLPALERLATVYGLEVVVSLRPALAGEGASDAVER